MDGHLQQKLEADQSHGEVKDVDKGMLQKGQDQLISNGLDYSANYQGNIVDSGIAGDDCSAKEDDLDTADYKVGQESDHEQGPGSGDIFSPDSADVVTVICKGDEWKAELEEQDSTGWDGSDTHSDSIETLEEESPHEDSISDSVFQQVGLLNSSGEAVDSRQKAVSCATKETGQVAEDSLSADTGNSRQVNSEVSSAASVGVPRPESLSLPRPLQHYERNRSSSEPQQEQAYARAVRAEASNGHQRTRSEAIDIQGVKVRGDLSYGDDIMSRSLPHGTLTRKGALVEFVADDLTEKIKRSSPMSGADSSSMGSRRSSQRSLASTSSATSVATSSGVSRSPSSLLTQSPDAAPPIDPSAIMDLEMAARRVADNVDHMMGSLRNNLHKMSAITVGCSEAYKTSVDITCESVDSSIKSMYALMAKCEELSTTMTPVYQIASQIKEIKRLLDRFEAQLSEKA